MGWGLGDRVGMRFGVNGVYMGACLSFVSVPFQCEAISIAHSSKYQMCCVVL